MKKPQRFIGVTPIPSSTSVFILNFDLFTALNQTVA